MEAYNDVKLREKFQDERRNGFRVTAGRRGGAKIPSNICRFHVATGSWVLLQIMFSISILTILRGLTSRSQCIESLYRFYTEHWWYLGIEIR